MVRDPKRWFSSYITEISQRGKKEYEVKGITTVSNPR
jgi:hypothetical protein